MKLSACMIVKNEERDLGRCLDSIVDHVDELIIVDTGSTDKTMDIVRGYIVEPEYAFGYEDDGCGIHLHEYEWTGDFSAARNYSMDLATGDRILIIDADEWVVDGNWDAIREAIKHPDFICGTMQVINTTRQGPVRGESVIQPRIFRNEKGDGSREKLRYVNKVHNQIDDAIQSYGKEYHELTGRQGAVVGIGAKLMHTGYDLTAEQILEKYTPRLATLRGEVSRAKREGNQRDVTYYEFQLALMFHMVFDNESAIPIWETLEYSELNPFNRWYAHYIASRAYMTIGDLETAMRHCEGMLESMASEEGVAIPDEPVTYTISGRILCEWAKGHADEDLYKEGLILLIEGYLKNIKPAYGVRCIMDPEHLVKDIAGYLGMINEGEAMRLSVETDTGAIYRILREVQKDISPFDESLLELVER